MKLFVAMGSLLGLLGVAAGAFGAHALEARLDADMLAVWETAAKYQMYHALALFGAAWLVGQTQTTWATVAGWAFLGGVVVFSGTLYVLALSGIKWLGAITPIGGTAMIVGWFCCFMAALKLN
ncbi:DUF423 domain-containing protein [Persicimonas caeni]|jgi:uncharacterized membrane protein YgdD (TMEM256/DUF423 family)|uniref:DUF423 domain-containing protein n=1 Tax=Persicimonas caeni TaxID=2292766 RepID=A0A4Y6PU52_PERCE|nr:DUF423 domain-containing protein [Persicimonas caeni]QDG51649.1 DUF423 domain-containing protein [Persicimonas caeni]QED32870.1 DUF423 domain-containing protein [Persicimonas caeni]